MRPLLNCITVTAFTTCIALVATSSARGQQLQWVHSSQQKAKTAAATPAPTRAPAVKPRPQQVEVRQATAKQPTFRQPTQLKQPSNAKPVPPRAMAEPEARAERVAQAAPQQGKPAQRVASADTRYSNRRPSGRYTGPMSRPGKVTPAQWEELPPGYTEGPYEESTYAYAGEVGCGFPEPSCGCTGPCGCGDGGYYDEPGCGFPYGNDVVFGGPAPAVAGGCCGECVDGTCGCGDACCTDVCEPTCGCGGAGCDNCHWPQALFGCDERGCVPILWVPPIKELTFFGGVHGFKNPLDGDRDGGNFGFQEGFNIGGKMAWLPWPGLGYQFGYQATQNQLSGDANTGTDSAHSQHFLTTGLFRRQRLGLQFGVVWDMLRDERRGAHDFGQIRGEVAYKSTVDREFGFAFMSSSNDNPIDGAVYQAADQYLLYYRILGQHGGECRAFAGFTGQSSNAIIGGDFQTPLTNRWSLEGNWTYLIPDSGTNGSAARDEGWNLSMQLVWHYGCRAKSWQTRPFRPMFDVADNGSLIVVD